MKKSFSLIFLILSLLLAACNSASQSDEKLPLVSYCDLVANPSQYDSQVVHIRASQVSGFEWSFLTDEKCSGKSFADESQTWIIIPSEANLCENASQVSTASPPQLNRRESLEREVIITGVFHNSPFRASAHEYTFKMDFICLEKAGKWQVVQNE